MYTHEQEYRFLLQIHKYLALRYYKPVYSLYYSPVKHSHFFFGSVRFGSFYVDSGTSACFIVGKGTAVSITVRQGGKITLFIIG